MKGIFDAVAAGVPVPTAVNISQQLSDNEFALTSDLMEDLETRQAANDAYNNEKRELELALLRKQLEEPTNAEGGGKPKPKSPVGDKDKKGHSYSDRLEQKKHEKIGEGRTKNIAARQESKKL